MYNTKGDNCMSERLKVGLIILGIYFLFFLYLLFASYRVEKLNYESQENVYPVVQVYSK